MYVVHEDQMFLSRCEGKSQTSGIKEFLHMY